MADAFPVCAASDVRAHVLLPSALESVQPVGGNIANSNPWKNGNEVPVPSQTNEFTR